jgi:hypothetical protein
MKLVGLVILGLITSIIVYFLLFLLLTKVLGDIGEAGIPLSILGVTPLALLIGSFLTGYFSYYDIEEKWSLLLMAPALYLELAGLCGIGLQFLVDIVMGDYTPGRYGVLGSLLIAIGIGLYWYLSSAGGVFLGYYLRERFVKWWYRD